MATRADRRRDIMEAARDLFSQKGYHGVSLPDIAEAAGLSVGLIYYVFPKKEDILVAIVKETSILYRQIFEQMESIADPVERLDTVIDELFQGCNRNARVMMILYKDLSSMNKDARDQILAIERDTTAKIVDLIADGQRKGRFNPTVSAELAAFNIIGIGHLWSLKKSWLLGSVSFDAFVAEQRKLLHAMLRV